jgi:hypothetical protein
MPILARVVRAYAGFAATTAQHVASCSTGAVQSIRACHTPPAHSGVDVSECFGAHCGAQTT